MLVNIFTYGTLQVETVMQAVTGQQFAAKPAILYGYRRRQIKRRVYPAIVQEPAAVTNGTLYFDIDDKTIDLLDEFEDVLYDRLKVQVECDNNMIKAYAYIIKSEYENRLSDEDWDLQKFKKTHLQHYLEHI